jgi:hypothetical protein
MWPLRKCTAITGLENLTIPRLWRQTDRKEHSRVLTPESAGTCQQLWKITIAVMNPTPVTIWPQRLDLANLGQIHPKLLRRQFSIS